MAHETFEQLYTQCGKAIQKESKKTKKQKGIKNGKK